MIGQGTAGLDRVERAQAVAALRRGIELGMRHIDTAERYGDGRVEPIVAEAIAGRRDEVFLVSKVSGSHASRDGTVAACEGSLRRLRTDRLDCYLLHWPGPHPLEETVEAFEGLRRAGKIRSWGVSNLAGGAFAEVVRLAGPRLSCNQVVYNLERRDHERDVLPACREHGIAMVGYSPLRAGELPPADSPGGVILRDVAHAHGATPAQVVLSFLLRHSGAFVIPMATTIAHVEQNAAAADLEVGPGEIRMIEAAFPVADRGPHRVGR